MLCDNEHASRFYSRVCSPTPQVTVQSSIARTSVSLQPASPRVASVHSSSLAATTKHYLEPGLPSCFQFSRPSVHHARCIRRARSAYHLRASPGMRFSLLRLRILQRIPPMNRTSRHCRAVRVAMLSRHTYEVASTAVSMKGDVRMWIQDTSSLSPHLRYHEPSDSN